MLLLLLLLLLLYVFKYYIVIVIPILWQVQQTSALAINLIGHAKDICSFAAALLILHERFSATSM
jgi:hypothetical protein